MASKTLEKLADKIIRLTPDEGEQLALIIQAKMLPEIQRQRQGLLQQQQSMNPQMAGMGQPRGGSMQMPTSRDAARQGLLQ
tara:strand:+ start:1208 stop:1450 length:243 start_codon:yes stop_codon:yes gene_type:complete